MSIDISCYTTTPLPETEEILNRVASEHSDLFPHCMTHPRAWSAKDVDTRIASDYGLTPRSAFLVSVNDKSQAYRVPELAKVLRNAFEANASSQRILILRDNEQAI